MTDLMKIVANCETGEVMEIPMTPEEIADRELMAIEYAARKAAQEAEAEAKAAAKASAEAKLAALGLTAEEIAAL